MGAKVRQEARAVGPRLFPQASYPVPRVLLSKGSPVAVVLTARARLLTQVEAAAVRGRRAQARPVMQAPAVTEAAVCRPPLLAAPLPERAAVVEAAVAA